MDPVTYYMAAIDLRGRSVLVVGAGRIALEKIEGLLACDAHVTVVAVEVSDSVRALADDGRVEVVERAYEPGDLAGRTLVVAATADTEVNTAVSHDAQARDLLVNVVDVPSLCTFILPAVARRGPLAVAISTGGASPALAKRMRSEAEAMFDDAYARLAELLEELRPWAKASLATYDDRKAFFEAIVAGSPDPIALLREGREDEVRALIEAARKEHGG